MPSPISALILTLPLLAISTPPPVAADDPLSFPCGLVPADATAENGVGAEPGAEPREFCSNLAVPPACTAGGYFFVGATVAGFTRTTGAPALDYTALVRSAPAGGGPPGTVMAGPFARAAFGVPAFPAQGVYVRDAIDLGTGRFSVGFDAIQLTSSCTQLSGLNNQGQFLTVDESAATPLTPCYTGTNGGPIDDPCKNGNPNLRATSQGLFVGPQGGPASGDREVPPSGSAGRGVCLGVVDDPRAPARIVFFVQAFGIPTPTAMHVHQGRVGANGPIVYTFSSLPAPNTNGISESWDGVGEAELAHLASGDYYINVHTAANPNGEIRCQIESANQIFADGVETGDTSAWSEVQPLTAGPTRPSR